MADNSKPLVLTLYLEGAVVHHAALQQQSGEYPMPDCIFDRMEICGPREKMIRLTISGFDVAGMQRT